jgi:hypothetical protein
MKDVGTRDFSGSAYRGRPPAPTCSCRESAARPLAWQRPRCRCRWAPPARPPYRGRDPGKGLDEASAEKAGGGGGLGRARAARRREAGGSVFRLPARPLVPSQLSHILLSSCATFFHPPSIHIFRLRHNMPRQEILLAVCLALFGSVAHAASPGKSRSHIAVKYSCGPTPAGLRRARAVPGGWHGRVGWGRMRDWGRLGATQLASRGYMDLLITSEHQI